MRRGVISLLFFLLSTSCARPVPQWSCQEVPELQVARKTTCKNQELESLSVDIFEENSNAYVYLNLHHLPLRGLEEDVELLINDQVITTKGHVLSGGQKVLLPPKESALMLEALNNHQQVTVNIACYSKVLEAF